MSPKKIDISSGFKDCTRCNEHLPLTDFFLTQTRGYERYQSHCKDCVTYTATIRRWRRWGITNPEEVWDLKQEHDGLCDICEAEGGLHMDHCHVTGRFRGFLCSNCNHGLGQFKDSLELLERAKRYLS